MRIKTLLCLFMFLPACAHGQVAVTPEAPPTASAPENGGDLLTALCLMLGLSPCTAEQAETNTSSIKTTIEVGDFDREGMVSVYRQFYRRTEAGEKTVIFNINSNGGSVFGGMELIKLIEDIKKQKGVHTVCIVDTHAYSMGFIFLQSGACDERYMTERSTLLAHNASASSEGTADEMEEIAELIRQISLAMAHLVCTRMNMPLDEYLARIQGRDWMLGYQEALHVGAIDGLFYSKDLPPRGY